GLAGLRRAAASERERTAHLVTRLHDADDILPRAGHDDADRLDAVHARVGGIERPRDAVEPDLALDRAFERAAERLGVDPLDRRLWHRRARLDVHECRHEASWLIALIIAHMSGRPFLQTPGPTNVPDRVLHAIGQPTIDHRSAEFAALTREVLDGLKRV